MAYMRGSYYVYGDGEGLNIHAPDDRYVRLPDDIAESLGVMIFFRLVRDGRAQEVIERTYKEYGGNFGADGVAAFLGKPTTMDMIKEMVDQQGEH